MKRIALTFVFLFMLISLSQAQIPDYNIDSMMSLRKLDSLTGSVKTYYSPGNKNRAIDGQDLIQKAVSYYIEKYKIPFSVKLAILDSSQWVHDILPWGFNFFSNGWAIVNAATNPEMLLSALVSKEKRSGLDSVLRKQNLSLEEFLYKTDMVTIIHELGHHYVMKILKISTPGMWFNEIGANYFAYNFFNKMGLPHYQQMIPAYQFAANSAEPQYKEIITWDTLNVKMPSDNFVWFDAHTQILIQNIYSEIGETFLDNFIKTFSGKQPHELELEYTINEIDRLTNGMVKQWRTKMRKP